MVKFLKWNNGNKDENFWEWNKSVSKMLQRENWNYKDF